MRPALLLGLAIAAPVAAAEPAKFREHVLPNGLKVLSVEDFTSPVVAVHIWYHVGSKDEMAGRQGFAHMFEHMMFRGTDRLGSEEHIKLIRRAGGECNAYTSFDQTVYVQELPASRIELALWLEAERMAFLRIDQTAYDTERKVVEEERRLGLNKPYGSIPEKALAELFPGRAYAWSPIGNIAHLRAAPVSDLRSFWQRYYVPNNATLVIVGAVKHDDVQRLATKYFGWMPRDADPPRVTPGPPAPFTGRSVTLQDDTAPAPAVGVVWRGVPAAHPDSIPLQLLGTILGGGESSRIYRELVAERQLAVVALSAAMSFELDGILAAGAVMSPFSRSGPQVVGAILKQVERLRTEPVTEKELLKARNQMLFSIVNESRTVASRARALGTAAVIEGDANRINERLNRVRSVTADDLRRVAQKYLGAEHAVRGTIEQNLLGALMGKKPSAEESSPITAKPETTAVSGKPGLRRPADFPDRPPSAAALQPSKPMTESFTLKNGLKVIVIPRPGVPYVATELTLLAGAWSEPKPGTASLAMGMLTKGTTKRSEKELADELETYAISLSGGAQTDYSAVSASSLTDHWPRAIGLLAEAVRSPAFPAAELEKLRKQTLAGLAISARDPANRADRELSLRLFGDHPYGRTVTGQPDDVQKVAVDDLKTWWALAARPDRALLEISGDVDVATARTRADSAFGDWVSPPEPAPSNLPEVAAPGPTQIYLVDQPGAIQSQIRIGQRGPRRSHSDYPIYRLIGDYFGGAFSSRLNEVIRVQKGLTYGARGGFSPSRFDGRFVVSTFSKTESTVAAVQAALDEVARLRTVAPTAGELSDSRASLAGKVLLARETPQQVAEELRLAEVHGLPADHVERTLARIAAATADDCVGLARSAIDPAKLVIVVVGSAEKIKADLEKIGPVTVVK